MHRQEEEKILEELNEEFINLYQKEHYLEANRLAKRTYLIAKRRLGEEHPASFLWLNNIKISFPDHENNKKTEKEKNGSLYCGMSETGKKSFLYKKVIVSIVLSFVFGLFFLSPVMGLQPVCAPEPVYDSEAISIIKQETVTNIISEQHNNFNPPKEKNIIDAPLILQNPELPRGCEVTSLAMLLQYAGISVDKMTLAEEVAKDSTPYEEKDGQVYFGNPYDGFVGDMYSLSRPGYGVYHGPIFELMQKYLPQQSLDLTGMEFEVLLYFISQDIPVWVVANVRYSKLPPSQFQRWITPAGPVDITYRMHSVLLTGYDSKYVYFNDPLTGKKNKKRLREPFQEAWEQMGSQAVTYNPLFP